MRGVWSLLQTRVLSLPIFSFNLCVIYACSKKSLVVTEQENTLLIAGATIVIVFNFINIALTQIFFGTGVKSRNWTSTKTKLTDLLLYVQTHLLVAIMIFVDEGQSKKWITVVLNTLFTIWHFGYSFRKLPYYKLEWMRFELIFSGINATLAALETLNLFI